MTAADEAELLLRKREQQGLPTRVEDPAAAARVAALLDRTQPRCLETSSSRGT